MTKIEKIKQQARTTKQKKDEIIDVVLLKYGAFWAFGQDQFNAKKKEGVQYISLGAGLVTPKDDYKEMIKEFDAALAECKEIEKRSMSQTDLIRYHLNNYECYYIGDPMEAIEHCAQWGISADDVKKVYNDTKEEYNNLYS